MKYLQGKVRMILQQQTKNPKTNNENLLPPIPEKRYFTMSEASVLCGVKPHVLRYWEQEFPGLRPVKRRGNRRYYQHKDVITARLIRKLLYEEGFTIDGARTKLGGDVMQMNKIMQTNLVLKKMLADLQCILQKLKQNV